MLDDIIDNDGEKVPETKTREQRKKTPPVPEVTTDLEDSTTIDVYKEERKTTHSQVSPTMNFIVVYLRPTSQELDLDPRNKNNLLYSYTLDGIDLVTLRERMLPCLRELKYKGEWPLESAWEYVYPFTRRTDVKSRLKESTEKIKGEYCN